jgi:hypothetical protein
MDQTTPPKEPPPLAGKGKQKAPLAKTSPAHSGALKGKSSPAPEDSLAVLDLPNREKLNDFKSKVQSYLK